MTDLNRTFIAFLPVLIMFMTAACQEEKYTDKGIPEVELIAVRTLEDGGAVFEGRILSAGSEEVTEHGFLWSMEDNPLPGTAEKVLLGPGHGTGAFTDTATADIKMGQLYYTRAFVVTPQRLSLGDVTTFTGNGSQPAVLISVTPSEAVCGDTVLITGRNFSFTPGNNIVRFDGTPGKVISSGPEEITVIVPMAEEHPGSLGIEVSGLLSANTLPFAVKPPVLTSFSPATGTFNDIVTLTGNNFITDTSLARVYFNETRAEITEVSRTHYTVRVPPANNISPATVRFKYFNSYSYSEPFILKQAVISGVSPTKVKGGDIIVISGENFNPVPGMNEIMIGGLDARVVSCSSTEISVSVPPGLQPGNHSLSLVTLQGNPVTCPETIEVTYPWRRLNDFPGPARSSPVVFATDTHGYMGTGHDGTKLNDFWRYTPSSDEWTRVSDFPIPELYFASGFAIGDRGYVTLGKVDDYYYRAVTRYTPATDTWEFMSNKPGDGSSMKSPVFVINGKAYVPAAGEMYEYDPALNAWTKKAYPAELQYFGSGVAFSIGNKGYMGIGWIHNQSEVTPRLFEYDPVTDNWKRMADFPGIPRTNSVFFTLPNGKAYVGLGIESGDTYLNDMWEFDPVANIWTRVEDFPGSARYSAVAFSIGSKAYIGFGYDGGHRRDLWEFSPGGQN